jgi:predicted RNA-binding protein with PUA-like domain
MTKRDAQRWLMKSEPDVYSIADLEADGETGWGGVRNYQARNLMRDEMKVGDWVLFYHSNAQPSGVAGLAKVSSAPLPDPAQFDKKSDYFDATSTKAEPRWVMVNIAFVEAFERVVPLEVLKADPKLAGMALLQKGQRLSVQKVSPAHFAQVLALAGASLK